MRRWVFRRPWAYGRRRRRPKFVMSVATVSGFKAAWAKGSNVLILPGNL